MLFFCHSFQQASIPSGILAQLTTWRKNQYGSLENNVLTPNFLIKLPYCNRNKKLSKTLISKLNNFTGSKYIFIVLRQTKQKVFQLQRQKHSQFSCCLQRRLSCSESYIGETMTNVQVQIDEHTVAMIREPAFT